MYFWKNNAIFEYFFNEALPCIVHWMAYRCTAEEFLMSLRLESEDKTVTEVA